MKQCIALQDGFNAVCDHLEFLDQSDDSKHRYRRAFGDISEYYENRQASSYSPIINAEYRDSLLIRLERGDISKKKYHRCSRLSFMLDSHYAGEPIALKYSRGMRYKVKLDRQSQTKVDEFETFLEGKMASISIAGYVTIARDFFYFLQKQGLEDFQTIDDMTVRDFIVSCHECRPASMNNVCCAVRKILEFLRAYGCTVSAETAMYKAAPSRREIHPALDGDELEAILNAPDRNTLMGKRDYAVLLLASFTGLRAIDIANLRFDNYEPEQEIIHLIQHKTGNPISLPIPAEVVDAVNDYVINGRPDVANEYIFLTIDRPYRKLADKSSVRNILMRQLKNSALGYAPGTGHGFHIFRRTMGKWLLGASVSPEMISQVLGHRDGEVLKRYLPLTPDAMRSCSLGFDMAPLRSEVFA